MVFNLYDNNLVRLAQIDTFVSCLWTEKYNSLGSFVLELQAAPRFNKLFQPDCYIGMDERSCLMVIKTVVIDGGKIKISGFPATRVLDDRAFVGTVSNVNVEEFLLETIGDLDYTKLEAGTATGLTDTFTRQTSHKSVMGLCEIMCQETDMGFKIEKIGNNMVFRCYKPTYAYHPFRSAYGNLGAQKITVSNENLKNVAVVMGQGSGEERIIVRIGDTTLEGSARKELIIDARNIQQEEDESIEDYTERLISEGYDKLADRIATEQIQIDIASDLDLGDVATCYIDEYDFALVGRITTYTIKAQRNSKTVSIQIGDPIIVR